MTDTIKRLRKLAGYVPNWSEYYLYDMIVIGEAADEIEQLRGFLKDISEMGFVPGTSESKIIELLRNHARKALSRDI